MTTIEINLNIGQDQFGQVYYRFQKFISSFKEVSAITKDLLNNPDDIKLILKINDRTKLKYNLLKYNTKNSEKRK